MVLLSVAGIVITVAAMWVSYMIGRRARQAPHLRYCLDFDVLIDSQDRLFEGGLVVTSDGNPVTSVSRSRLIFWNYRGDTVFGSSILSDDPLRLRLGEDDRPLQIRVISTSRHQNSVNVAVNSRDRREVLIRFGYLDAGDGAIVEVIHCGRRPQVLGTIPGCRLSSRGSCDLRDAALESAAQYRLHKRMWHAATDTAGKLRTIALMIATSAVVGLTSYLAWDISREGIMSKNQLADVQQYDLGSLDGQARFASEVLEVGTRSPIRIGASIVAVGLLPTLVLFIGLTLYKIGRLKFPRAVVENYDKHREGVSSEEAGRAEASSGEGGNSDQQASLSVRDSS